jgi:hypothetical protein
MPGGGLAEGLRQRAAKRSGHRNIGSSEKRQQRYANCGLDAEVRANLCPSMRKPRMDGGPLGWTRMTPSETHANLGWV